MKRSLINEMINQNDFDPSIWRKAQIKNNSGYLDEQYQTAYEFPIIPDYHFRIQDDMTILQFQKLAINDLQAQPLGFQQSSDKFQNKLKGLLQGLDNAKMVNQSSQNKKITESHGFYDLNGQYDDQQAIKQAFNRIQVDEVQKKISNISLDDKKPKFIKKSKNLLQNKKQDGPQNMVTISKQMKKLSINEEDL